MCEFKIIRKNDNARIAEEILILSYSENNELLFRDILGGADVMESGLILDVNTMNQTTLVIEHPLARDFVGLLRHLLDNSVTKAEVMRLQEKLEEIKEKL